jgi:hypothetical protein
MISLDPALWTVRGQEDRRLKLLAQDGKFYTYDELIPRTPASVLEQITPEVIQRRYDECQRGVAMIGDRLRAAAADLLIVIGDDHLELFKEDGIPTFAIFTGDRAWCIPPPEGSMTATNEAARATNFGSEVEEHPCAPGFGKHLASWLTEEGFDVFRFERQFEGRPIGHAFTFMYRRVMKPAGVRYMQPITFNTYFPPNQMSPARCYAWGRALRRAIEAWDSDLKVAVSSSGGLSHFVVDEELDQLCLRLMKEKDVAGIAELPRERLDSGNSEVRNWFAVAGACEDRDMELLDYIPCYRSEAGTGCAMAFAHWT